MDQLARMNLEAKFKLCVAPFELFVALLEGANLRLVRERGRSGCEYEWGTVEQRSLALPSKLHTRATVGLANSLEPPEVGILRGLREEKQAACQLCVCLSSLCGHRALTLVGVNLVSS